MRTFSIAVALYALSAAAQFPPLQFGFGQTGMATALDPGSVATYQLGISTQFDDLHGVKLQFNWPDGVTLTDISQMRIPCTTSANGLTCTLDFLRKQTSYNGLFRLRMPPTDAVPDIIITGSATSETPSLSQQAKATTHLTHILSITNTNDGGAGSLRDVIETANRECVTAARLCKIYNDITAPPASDGLHLIEPQTPLPALTACAFFFDAGNPRQSSIPDDPTIHLSGAKQPFGNGLEIRSTCTGLKQFRGIVIDGFPENGVAMTAGGQSGTVVLQELIISNNRLRGVAVADQLSTLGISSSKILRNRFSGVALFASRGASITRSEISGNGASGVFALTVGVFDSTIAFNRDAGISILPGGKLMTGGMTFVGNVSQPIDWKIDGPTPDDSNESDGVPNAPELLDARYDATTGLTTLTGRLHTRVGIFGQLFAVVVYIDGHTLGTKSLWGVGGPVKFGDDFDHIFTIEMNGDFTGKPVSLQTIFTMWSDLGPENASELSPPRVVQ